MDYNLATLHKKKHSKNQYEVINQQARGGYEIFSTGEGGFSKKKISENFIDLFLGRPN